MEPPEPAEQRPRAGPVSRRVHRADQQRDHQHSLDRRSRPRTQTSVDWGQLTAIGTIVVAPMVLVGLVVRKWLVTGLTLGAVSGE